MKSNKMIFYDSKHTRERRTKNASAIEINILIVNINIAKVK